MKSLKFTGGLLLLIALPMAHGGPADEHTREACFSVNIQTNTVNHSRVEQDCGRNISRTVQAGEDNWAETVQTGEVNDNKVRQYHYNRLRFLDRVRRRN